MSDSQQNLQSTLEQAGFSTPASAAQYSFSEFSRRLGNHIPSDVARGLYRAARKIRNKAIIAEKSLLARHSPFLPATVSRGLRAPDISLNDYEEWIGHRRTHFASPDQIASEMGPGRFLGELYSSGKLMYDPDSLYHIDARRPDLATLILSQENKDKEVSVLALSNDILLAHLHRTLDAAILNPSRTRDEALQALAGHLKSAGTPYHYHHARLREVRRLQDPSFTLMQEAPAVIGQLSGSSLAGMYYDIPPALYDLLVEEIPEDEGEAQKVFEKYFGTLPPSWVLEPTFLKDWYGLTDEEVEGFMGSLVGEPVYINDRLIMRAAGKVYQITLFTQNYENIKKTQLFILDSDRVKLRFWPDGTVEFPFDEKSSKADLVYGPDNVLEAPLQGMEYIAGKAYDVTFTGLKEKLNGDFTKLSHATVRAFNDATQQYFITGSTFKVENLSTYEFILRLNKNIRLYKATGISPRVLEDIVNSVNLNQITDDTLNVLFRSTLLMQHYEISHEEALVMARGNISRTEHTGELSQWDRLFNNPPLVEGGFYLNSDTKEISLHPEENDYPEEKAVLRRACRTDDEGLYELGLCLFSPAEENADVTLDLSSLSQISGLYTLSQWARLHGLSPAGLRQLLVLNGLPKDLNKDDSSVWIALLEKLQSTVKWLTTLKLSPGDLDLLVRDVGSLPPGAEVINLLGDMQRIILQAGADYPVRKEGENDEAYRLRQLAERKVMLAPFIMNSFRLPGEAGGLALLDWIDGVKPGNLDVKTFWDELAKPGEEGKFSNECIEVAYSLAQMALIYHATGTTADILTLFVRKPVALFDGIGDVLPRSLAVVKTLSEFSHWIRTTPESSVATGVILDALRGDDGVTGSILAKATGLGQAMVGQAVVQKSPDPKNPAPLKTAQAILTALQWVHLAEAFSVLPNDLGLLLQLDYKERQGEPSEKDGDENWALWRRVADAFSAGLTPAQTAAAEARLGSSLSAALSGYLLAESPAFRELKLASREALSRYLLIDNLTGPQVKTTRVAEAIAALQTFIHRTLKSPEDKDELNRSALGEQFILEWPQWNCRFSTWAAKKLLMWYPENYLDPTLRLGQTVLMNQLLQELGKAQVNRDTVGDAYLGFLTQFEEVANLKTLCGYHDNLTKEAGLTWFLGRSQGEPAVYYWRTVDEAMRDRRDGQTHPQKLPANAWRGWTKINATFAPWNNFIRPVVYRDRLYVVWVEQQQHDENEREPVYRYLLRLSGRRYDDSWSAPVSFDITNELGEFKIPPTKIGFYASAWQEMDTLRVIFYDRDGKVSEGVYDKVWFGVDIYDDMTSKIIPKEDEALKMNIGRLYLAGQLSNPEESDYNPVIDRYVGPEVQSNGKITTTDPLPGPFWKSIDLFLDKVVIPKGEEEGKYGLTLNLSGNAQRILVIDKPHPCFEAVFNEPDFGKALRYSNKEADWLDGEELYIVVKVSSLNKYFIVVHESLIPKQLETSPIMTLSLSVVRGQNGEPNDPGNLLIRPWLPRPVKYNGYLVYYGERDPTWENECAMENAFPVIIYGDYSAEPLKTYWPDWKHKGKRTDIPALVRFVKKANFGDVNESSIKVILDSQYPSSDSTQTFPGNLTSWESKFLIDVQGLSTSAWGGRQEHEHQLTLTIGDIASKTWKLKVYQQPDNGIRVSLGTYEERGAQYLQLTTKQVDTPFPLPPKQDSAETNTRLNTLFARKLTEYAQTGIDSILSYDVQKELEEPPLPGADDRMDFSGANAIYFWELFYYTPMMVMQRFLQEESYELAEKWLNYIWNPAGYIEDGGYVDRIWNVRPLEEDEGWNDNPLESYDPDAVAQNDPMHYRAHVFMRNVDILIARGDAAYRKLERDTLVEARIWYERALDLMGEMPWVSAVNNWHNPTLGEVASASLQEARLDALYWLMTEGEKAPNPMSDDLRKTEFLPEVNSKLFGYWKTLASRMYNLRHSLTIDGQALTLPMFAAPADPKALLAAAVAAESGAGGGLPTISTVPALRFTRLLEGARGMVNQLMQFGSTLQQILERQDAEALSAMLNVQGAELAQGSISLQQQILQEIAAERLPLQRSLDAAHQRYEHYEALYREDVNDRELEAMNLMSEGQNSAASSTNARLVAAAMNLVPNTFGLASGGMVFGAVAEAAAIGFSIDGEVMMAKSGRIAQEEMYRRRREEWDIQRRSAQSEMAVLQAQLLTLDVRERSVAMQIEHAELQLAHAQAQLALFQSKFSGEAMYSWLRSQLTSIYYQFYDLTIARCLMAQKALQWELGDEQLFLRAGTWNGAWAGLMCGEALMLNLAQMESAWTKHQQREREITRIVSLDRMLRDKAETTLAEAIASALAGKGGGADGGVITVTKNGESLEVSFDLSQLILDERVRDSFGDDVTRRVRGIAVSLPGLVGPYQNVKADLMAAGRASDLPVGCDACTLSRFDMDNGLFQQGMEDGLCAPFEGMRLSGESVENQQMSLTFSHIIQPDQASFLNSLNDIVLHVQYYLRPGVRGGKHV